MSSDYLDYELSKKLHDLGVRFESPDRYWGIPCINPGELSNPTPMLLHPGSDMDSYDFNWQICDNKIPAPSTAQLIDEIQKSENIFKQLEFNSTEFIFSAGDVIPISDHIEERDQCATTALGKALIALIKEDTKCKQ